MGVLTDLIRTERPKGAGWEEWEEWELMLPSRLPA